METTVHYAINSDSSTEASYLRNLPLIKLLQQEPVDVEDWGMSCMPSTRRRPPRNNGSRLGRSIWTDEACQKASAGEFLYW